MSIMEDVQITYRDPKWLDTRGGNTLPNSWQDSSENPTLFNVVYHFLYQVTVGWEPEQQRTLQELIQAKYVTNGGKFMTNEYDDNDSFSLDESIAVAAASYSYGYKDCMKKLRIFTSQTWYRVWDVVPYLSICKYPILQILLVPQILIILSMLIGTLKGKEDSSGKQINFVMAMGLSDWFWMRWTFIICQAIVPEGYRFVFAKYYPEEDHPINVMARAIWLS